MTDHGQRMRERMRQKNRTKGFLQFQIRTCARIDNDKKLVVTSNTQMYWEGEEKEVKTLHQVFVNDDLPSGKLEGFNLRNEDTDEGQGEYDIEELRSMHCKILRTVLFCGMSEEVVGHLHDYARGVCDVLEKAYVP